MKPQTLQLKNFGPFINETIDFSKLSQAALFLITGKTGAGKTTIFDGMTYALFGETSGRLRSGKEMRSLFATPEEETSVFFSFEHHQLRYEIERKPEQMLAKRKGEGMRKQAAKVSLTIFDEKGKELRQLTKRSEVDQTIKELLNLDAKQFSQIVLLPQGEFRNFLISSSSEKEIVLRHLFGTQFFQQFNEQLKEKAKNQQKQLDHLEQELLLLEKQFLPYENDRLEEESSGFEMTISHWKIQQEQINEEITQEKEKLISLKNEQKELETIYYRGQSQKEALIEKQELLTKQQKLTEQAQEIAKKQEWLKHYEEAQKLLLPIERIQEYQEEQIDQKEKIKQLTDQLSEATFLYQKWQKQGKTRTEQQKVVETIQQTLLEKQRLIPLAKKYQQVQKELLIHKKESQGIQEKIEQLIQQQSTNQQKQQMIQETLNQQEILQEQRLIYERLKQEEQRYTDKQQEQIQLEKEQKIFDEQQQTINAQLAESRQRLDEQTKIMTQQKSDWAKKQIAKLQALLIPGEPCPVCGSTEHPIAHGVSDLSYETLANLEEKVNKTEKSVEQLHQEIGRKETEATKIQQQIEVNIQKQTENQQLLAQLEEEIKKCLFQVFHITSLDPIVKVVKEVKQSIDKQMLQLKNAKQEQLSLEEEGQTFKQEQLVLEKQKASVSEVLQQMQGEVNSLNNQLSGIETNTLEEEVAGLETQIQNEVDKLTKEKSRGDALKQKIAVLESQVATLLQQSKKTSSQIEQEQEKIDHYLSQQNYFATQAEIMERLNQKVVYEQDKKVVSEYQEQQLITTTRLNQLKNVQFDETIQSLEEISSQIDSVKSTIENQQAMIYRLQEQYKHNQKIMTDFTLRYKKSQQQLDELVQLQQLSQTMNGENPKKTSLERYVLQVYLQEVLQVANMHLKRLTKSRYQFELADEVGSYRGKTGLEINVYDDEAGMTRGSHTLSGGESFIAALSLALSLAEVIQTQTGGVTIEALFIDEGFGSLDDEALEMAMEALETVESEGRMIGIISHVRELKERILQQIRIDTKGSGQSHIRYHFG